MDLEAYRKKFNEQSAFLKLLGAEVTVLKEGYAEAELTVKPQLVNIPNRAWRRYLFAGGFHGGRCLEELWIRERDAGGKDELSAAHKRGAPADSGGGPERSRRKKDRGV